MILILSFKVVTDLSCNILASWSLACFNRLWVCWPPSQLSSRVAVETKPFMVLFMARSSQSTPLLGPQLTMEIVIGVWCSDSTTAHGSFRAITVWARAAASYTPEKSPSATKSLLKKTFTFDDIWPKTWKKGWVSHWVGLGDITWRLRGWKIVLQGVKLIKA